FRGAFFMATAARLNRRRRSGRVDADTPPLGLWWPFKPLRIVQRGSLRASIHPSYPLPSGSHFVPTGEISFPVGIGVSLFMEKHLGRRVRNLRYADDIPSTARLGVAAGQTDHA